MHGNMFSSTWVAACTSGAMPYRECAETAELSPITACQRSDDLIENRVHDVLKVPLVEARVLLSDALNKFGFDHCDVGNLAGGRISSI